MSIEDIEDIIYRARLRTKTVQRCGWSLDADCDVSLTITIVCDDPRGGAFFERALANEFGLRGMAPWFDAGGCEVKHSYSWRYAEYRLSEINRQSVNNLTINNGGAIEVNGKSGGELVTDILPLFERPRKAFDELPSVDAVENSIKSRCFISS